MKKESHIRGLLAIAFIVLAAHTVVHGAVSFTFTKIVDSSTPIPNVGINFQQFSAPALENGQIYFQGSADAIGRPPAGLFRWNGALSIIANNDTIVPDVPWPGNPPEPVRFQSFSPPSVSGGNVAFGGVYPGGIYIKSGSSVSRVADTQTLVPGGPDPFYFGTFQGAVISGNDVAFTGSNPYSSPGQGGVYVQRSGSLQVVADVNTAIPGGTGTFALHPYGWWPGGVAVDGDVIAFTGGNSSGGGVYKSHQNSLELVADNSTPIPGKSEPFFRIEAPAVNGDDVAFIGTDHLSAGGNWRAAYGVYLSHGGELRRIADISDDLGPASFALHQGNFVLDNYDYRIHTTLGGQLSKVIEPADGLDGKGIYTIAIGPQALSGNQIAFQVQFGPADGWASAIYLATANVSLWNTDADGNWSNNGPWNGGSPGGVGANASLGPVTSTHRIVQLDAPKTLGNLVLNSDHGYTITGTSTLTLQESTDSAAVTVRFGSHSIDAPVQLASPTLFDVQGANAVLSLTELLPSGQAITKKGEGRLEVNHIIGSSLAVQGGTVRLTGISASKVGSLSVASGAGNALDLNQAGLVIDDVGASLESSILALVQTDRLITSDQRLRVGYARASDLASESVLFLGQTANPDDFLIRATFGGDATLDGFVSVADLAALARHFNSSANWSGGDFDYNGIVNIDDLKILASNWNAEMNSPAAPALESLLTAMSLPDVTVPEPAMIAWPFLIVGLTQCRSRITAAGSH